MEILVKTAQFILSLSILIILHEFGHYLFAKLFKTRVEKFYLFFNPWFSVFKFQKGETEYGMGWLPLGGYVKISGMIDESMDKEQMKEPPKPYEFRSKPAWQRLLIMLGGVLVNFLLALVIYSMMLFVWGERYLPNQNVEYGIMVDSLATEIGLQNGDKIVALDGEEVDDFFSISPNILLNEVKTITVKRDNASLQLDVPESIIPAMIKTPSFIAPRIPFQIAGFPKEGHTAKGTGLKEGDRIIGFNGKEVRFYDQVRDLLQENKGKEVSLTVTQNGETRTVPVEVSDEGQIGVMFDRSLDSFFELKTIKYGFFESIPAGINKGVNTVKDYLKQFKLIFKPETKAYESLGGFLKIGSFFPGTWDWRMFWNMTAFLSIILAVMNILPIPALDGGHVTFLLYEIVTGRKPGDKFLEYAQIVGMVILLSLLVFANGNDIVQLLKK
ncbi:MAG: RIP metalloprotease RseP [Bacteroidota bacterium]